MTYLLHQGFIYEQTRTLSASFLKEQLLEIENEEPETNIYKH